jgi:hypothetical protein
MNSPPATRPVPTDPGGFQAWADGQQVEAAGRLNAVLSRCLHTAASVPIVSAPREPGLGDWE